MGVNFIVIALVALMRTPVFITLLACALLGFYISEIPLEVISVEIYRIADTPMLVALPLFTLTGYLLAAGNTSARLVQLSQALLGWLPGHLALIALITCALFTAFTGASGITIVAIGALLYPALKQVGYSERFSLGLVTSSGSLGLLLAPSLPLILYGIIAQQMDLPEPFTIKELFIAGIMPALLMIALLYAWSIYAGGSTIQSQPFSLAALKQALSASRWEVPLPLLVFWGIYSGTLAISETATLITAYVLFAQVVLYRDIPLRNLPAITLQAMTMIGGILLILAVSLALSNVLIDAQIPTRLFEWIQQHVQSKWGFLVLLNLFLLVLGAFLDIFSATIIMVPLLLPIAIAYGIDPIHLGIIFLANMQIGYFTPPVGMNLFISSHRFNKPITELYRSTLPFMGVLLVALLLITYAPWFSMGLLK